MMRSGKGMSELKVLEPCAGLGNRLMAMASFFRLCNEADACNRAVVLWKREMACFAKFSDLFVDVRELARIEEITQMPMKHLTTAIDTMIGNSVKKGYLRNISYIEDCDTMLLAKKYPEAVKELIVSEQGCYFKATGYMIECGSSDFSWVKPSNRVIQRGKKLWARIDENTVGVHIRRTDHEMAISESPTDRFCDEMEKEIETNSATKFYVATDDIKELNYLREKYQNRIIGLADPDYLRYRTSGQVDAVVDMYGLSRCKKIIGSSGSTFSGVASLIGNIPLEIIKKSN